MILQVASALGPLSVTIMLIVLSELSRRLGAVLKKAAWYRGYYVAAALTLMSSLVGLYSLGISSDAFHVDEGDNLISLLYTTPLASGVCLGLIITWRYWGWLVYASDGKTLSPRRTK